MSPPVRLAAVAAAAGCLFACSSSSQTIGIFLDPQATTCVAQVGSEAWTTLYVVCTPGGAVDNLNGAQFRIYPAPPGWTTSNAIWIPEPNALNFGHPLCVRVNVVFNQCVSMPGGTNVQLGRLFLFGAPTPPGTTLRVIPYSLAPGGPLLSFRLGLRVVSAAVRDRRAGGAQRHVNVV